MQKLWAREESPNTVSCQKHESEIAGNARPEHIIFMCLARECHRNYTADHHLFEFKARAVEEVRVKRVR